jgi:hypothetical protein
LPKVLEGTQIRRVQEVKMLLRSVALIWYMKHQMFTRSLDICLSWLDTLNPHFASRLQEQMARLDEPQQEPFEIAQLCDWLSENFYELWEQFS